ncbi:hypothetical protein [Pseudomonas sp. R45(2017)]|uniref:hypothetical protein n=1 Tax=Pseudomonas sp. R45(2017) TaxID=1981678 RepID=UPI00111C3F5E|nr:hypothetical protein [Pseudomonas sp. R45(2017)]
MTWSVAIRDTHVCSLESLRLYQYVAFVVDGIPKSIGKIARWSFDVGDDDKRVAFFSLLSNEISGLSQALPSPVNDILWLTRDYAQQAQSALSQNAREKPTDAIPTLDIDDASKSVARRFGIDPSRVEIIIRSKTATE